MSLKYRIALTVFLLEAVMVVLVLWQTLEPSLERTTRQIAQSDQVLLNLLGDVGKVAIITQEFNDLQIQFEKTEQDPHISEIFLLSRDGIIVASNNAGDLGRILPIDATLAEATLGESYWQHLRILGSSGAIGRISIKFSNAALFRSNADARIRGLIVAGFSMVMIAIVGLLLGFALSRRLERLAGIADRAAEGDFFEEFGMRGKDEVARVGRSFDLMLKKTRESLTALQTELSERKQVEQELRISEERLSMAMSASKAGFWIRDIPLTKVIWSDENYRRG
jgi:PAS domain-containing protein